MMPGCLGCTGCRRETRSVRKLTRVRDLDRSMNFYPDASECLVALHEPKAALLFTPEAFSSLWYRVHQLFCLAEGLTQSQLWSMPLVADGGLPFAARFSRVARIGRLEKFGVVDSFRGSRTFAHSKLPRPRSPAVDKTCTDQRSKVFVRSQFSVRPACRVLACRSRLADGAWLGGCTVAVL